MTIIILSAYDYSEIEAEAREAGVDEFIAKSLFRSRLTATLKISLKGNPIKRLTLRLQKMEKKPLKNLQMHQVVFMT